MNKIFNCDCFEGLNNLKDNSIDAVITDPPYGYSLCGLDWDKALPSIAIWEECLRVLKPGGWCLVMSAPRQDVLSRMMINLEKAGFKTDFTSIYWTYFNGFPKAMNISKAIDRRGGEYLGWFGKYLENVLNKRGMTQKELAKHFLSKNGRVTGCVHNWITGKNKPSPVQFNKICGILDLPFSKIEEVEREVVGKKTSGLGSGDTWAVKQNGSNSDKTKNKGIVEITAPKTNKAIEFNGSYSGFQPKPAVEVIIVAMKPLSEKTYIDQALKNGKGVTWLDDCRIPAENKGKPHELRKSGTMAGGSQDGRTFERFIDKQPNSRFPANLLVSDDALNDGKIRKSGDFKKHHKTNGRKTNNVYGKFKDNHSPKTIGDSGSASRFFDLDAWAKENGFAQPNMYGDCLKSVKDTFPFLCVPKPSKTERDLGCEEITAGSKNSNYHPTVKSLKLFYYLITLTTRKGDTVIDPFMGSGTTGIAASLSGRNFIGYEIDENYFNIAEHRLSACDKCRKFVD